MMMNSMPQRAANATLVITAIVARHIARLVGSDLSALLELQLVHCAMREHMHLQLLSLLAQHAHQVHSRLLGRTVAPYGKAVGTSL